MEDGFDLHHAADGSVQHVHATLDGNNDFDFSVRRVDHLCTLVAGWREAGWIAKLNSQQRGASPAVAIALILASHAQFIRKGIFLLPKLTADDLILITGLTRASYFRGLSLLREERVLGDSKLSDRWLLFRSPADHQRHVEDPQLELFDGPESHGARAPGETSSPESHGARAPGETSSPESHGARAPGETSAPESHRARAPGETLDPETPDRNIRNAGVCVRGAKNLSADVVVGAVVERDQVRGVLTQEGFSPKQITHVLAKGHTLEIVAQAMDIRRKRGNGIRNTVGFLYACLMGFGEEYVTGPARPRPSEASLVEERRRLQDRLAEERRLEEKRKSDKDLLAELGNEICEQLKGQYLETCSAGVRSMLAKYPADSPGLVGAVADLARERGFEFSSNAKRAGATTASPIADAPTPGAARPPGSV